MDFDLYVCMTMQPRRPHLVVATARRRRERVEGEDGRDVHEEPPLEVEVQVDPSKL
jgi:hypothetical protein